MSEKTFEYEEMKAELVPDTGEGNDLWGSREYADKELMEKPENIPKTPAERGREMDKVQGVVRKMGALALLTGNVQGRIDRFWTPEREAKVAA